MKRLICGWFQIKRLEPSYCLSTIRRDWQSFNTRTIERSPVRRRPFLHTTTRWRLINTAQEIFCVVSVAPEGHFVKWDGTKWIHDANAENEHLLMLAEQEKINLLAVATSAIAPLQDAVDLDMATKVETALLLEWKKYRVLLNRVDISKPEWPTTPNIQAS